ncbi:HmuY family protein [Mucilaginibacter sp. 22184]|uniref:HmuY family protein n=1 Tax=Mucilaginibacter sp. 22184 TaxID=3453887 RepID=UPI003F860BDB
MRSITHNLTKWLGVLTIAGMLFSSCSKSNNPEPDPKTDTPAASGSVPFYKLQRVENFSAPTDDSAPTTAPPVLYFSLENKAQAPADYQKTARWDLSFSNLYNSFIGANNGKDATNPGYTANGVGGILILKQAFETVTDVPADKDFSTSKTFGTDDQGAFGEGTGWYLYDFGGNIRGDGSYNKQHVAYAMPESRTLVVRTATGNYAKIKMISCYKDVFTADKWFRDTPHMYFTFEYVIVPKGSTKFEIK